MIANNQRTPPKRQPVVLCKIGTYKYFFPEEIVFDIWEALEVRYGQIQTTTHIMQIRSRAFIFRSTPEGNPIIVIRRDQCTTEDLQELHKLFNVSDEKT